MINIKLLNDKLAKYSKDKVHYYCNVTIYFINVNNINLNKI